MHVVRGTVAVLALRAQLPLFIRFILLAVNYVYRVSIMFMAKKGQA